MLALGKEEMHGYAIMQEVRRRTKGQRRLAPRTLYPSLKQMHERGLLAELEGRPEPGLDDERRRYYRLTDLGGRVALAEVERLKDMVNNVVRGNDGDGDWVSVVDNDTNDFVSGGEGTEDVCV